MSDLNNTPVEASDEAVASNRPVKSKRGRRLLIAIIILLLLGLGGISALLLSLVAPRAGVASKEEAKGIEWIKSIYGWGSTPETQLNAPTELMIDDDGIIWVADSKFNDRLLGFNPEGKLARTVLDKSKEKGPGLGPMTRFPNGLMFVGESAMDRMRVFDAEGNEVGRFEIPNPIDLATDGAERLVVGSTAGFAIINPETGEPIKIVGERGKGDAQFDTVNGVTMDEDGNIYVVDAYNNRLSAYDPQGERRWMVATGAAGNEVDLTGGGAMAASSETTAPARLQLPADITIDGRGRLVVVDAMDFTVSVFDPEDGRFIAKYGDYGQADGKFVYPSSIDYDEQRDWFAVADAGNARVQIIRIPDSGASQSPVAGIRRSLAGPLRACLIPLALLIILAIAYVVVSIRRKRAARAHESVSSQPETEFGSES